MKMNKYEKRFLITDIICTALLGAPLVISFILKNYVMMFVVFLIFVYYYFRMRVNIWNSLTKKEEAERYNLPKDWKEELENPVKLLKAKKEVDEDE